MKKLLLFSIMFSMPILFSSCFIPGVGYVGGGADYDTSAYEAQIAQLDSEAVARRAAAGVSEQQYKTYQSSLNRHLMQDGSNYTAAVEAARIEAGISKPALQQIHSGQSAPQSKTSAPATTKQSNYNTQPLAKTPDYPKGLKIPSKNGFVFSPYSRKLVDVSGIPSGTLVLDPTDTQRRNFRVP